MTVSKLIENTGWTVLSASAEKEIANAYICDLLSWVMAHGECGTAWVTVQTHLNVAAVASLHDFSCVIIPENIEVSKNVLSTASDKGVCFVSAPVSSYGVARKLAELGISDV